MFPLYVPAARPAGLAVTVRLAFPVPEPGETESHVPPELALALAVKLWLLLTCTVCVAGRAPPWEYAKASVEGLTERAPLPTLKVTATCVTTPEPVVSVIVP